ncbi:hypothetical protein NC658_14910 [Streptomyces griseoincarnatus]|uniref:Uncharacterized protein n=1 Tax=Streptomyces griseoincarnatus TaxID=29305 RepID=A0ABT0VTI6_STRGI|nr:hypothetical protein [Streptomyces griseoincarnatus]MCM2514547.1 hypothetical protein [Streptomyces griseoincarnatus]
MDSTETARRLLGHGAASRPYAQLTGGHAANTPIYAELVAEWRAKGYTVPGHREGVWASFAVMTAGDRGPAPAVPFRVPVPLPAAGASDGVSDGAAEEVSEAAAEVSEQAPSQEPAEEMSSEVTCEETPVADGASSRRTPGAAAPRVPVSEQALEPDNISSQDSAPR